MAHTPGPWTNDRGLVNGKETRARVGDGISIDIFDAAEWPADRKDEALANAALIAAAPDLLAAARSALNFIENTEGELGIKLDSGDALRAAIAKVEALDHVERQARGEKS